MLPGSRWVDTVHYTLQQDNLQQNNNLVYRLAEGLPIQTNLS